MSAIVAFLQTVYFAWIVAVIAIIVAFRKDKHYKDKIKNLEDKELAERQKIVAQSNETIHQTRDQCQAEIQHRQELFDEKIRLLQEQIDADKAIIMKKTEKEILADITVSLNGFAKRIDRVEKNLTSIDHEMELMVDKVDNIGVTVSDAQFHL